MTGGDELPERVSLWGWVALGKERSGEPVPEGREAGFQRRGDALCSQGVEGAGRGFTSLRPARWQRKLLSSNIAHPLSTWAETLGPWREGTQPSLLRVNSSGG